MNMKDDGNIVNGDYYRDPSADIKKHGGVPVYRKVKDNSDPPEFDERALYLSMFILTPS